MRANRAYRLAHRRHPDADQIEVVDVASGEALLFWDVRHADARRFVGALKADLAGLQDEEFLARWGAVRGPADL